MKDKDLTEIERELVKNVLTRAWLSMEFVQEDDRYEDDQNVFPPLSKEEMNILANAINKI